MSQSNSNDRRQGPRATGFVRAQPPEVGDSYRTKALKAYKTQKQDTNISNGHEQPPSAPAEDLDLADLLDSGRKAA